MRITFLHTDSCSREVADLISDIVSYIKDNELCCFQSTFVYRENLNIIKVCKLRKYLKTNKIDIIHAYSYVDAFYALLASRNLGVKVIYSCYSYHDRLNRRQDRLLRYVLSNVDTIIFQSRVQKEKFITKFNLPSDKCTRLLHAFYFTRYDNQVFASIRDEYFIDDFKYLIGTVGDFSPEHNVMNVFKMVKQLRKTGRNFNCVVAGGRIGQYDSFYDDCRYYYLIQGLDNYITYLGHRDDSLNIILQLDAFVYHSDNEAIAIPVIEALISGVNVVVNDDEMIKEITHNGKYAILYESNNEKDFAAKTRDLLLDLDDYRMISEVVKEECRNIFSIDNHIEGLKEIYSKILKK